MPCSNKRWFGRGWRAASGSAGIGPAPALLAAVLFLAATGGANADSLQRPDLTPEDAARVARVTAPATSFAEAEKFEPMAGGAATSSAAVNRDAFSHFSANLDYKGEQDFKLGNGLFRKLWVAAPSSTQASDGLGPLYNARSCQRCHLKDGRGHPPEGLDDLATSMFLRLAVPPRTEEERRDVAEGRRLNIAEPTYGGQLQDFAVPGLAAEGRMRIAYEEIAVPLAGGETASLRKPSYSVSDLAYGDMDPEVTLSPRVAPPMIGLGLLEAIHPADIRAAADPEDGDGDGISGRLSLVRDAATGAFVLGRFGWKASAPSVRAQSAGAFAGDIGISSPDSPDPYGDCTLRQAACRQAPTGVQAHLGKSEAPPPVLDLVEFYSRNLAVPVRRDVGDPEVLRGKAVFYELGCAACHRPKYVTAHDAAQPEHRFQLIWPYTDLLLHDMGEGLADGQAVGMASGREWRTAPLWGIGLTEAVSGHTYFLHDGRARSLLEAVLWHGGEAQAARDGVAALSPGERAALLRFLESL
jgi:CxxC motif-containing protein (DUF1111 family)